MLNHSHPSLPEMRLTPVPQDLAKRTTVVEEFSPQPKSPRVIVMIHSGDNEYDLDVSELSDDDIDAISKLIGFAMKMKSVDDLRLFIAEHQSLQLIDEAVHLLYSQIGKADTQASTQVPEEYQFPKPMTLKEYGILDGTTDPERNEMPTFLQTHFPSNDTPGFSIVPYLMENFCLTEDSTPASISVGLRNLTDNAFRSIAGKSLDELAQDITMITTMEHDALLVQRDEVMCHFIKQLNPTKQQAESKQPPTTASTTPTTPPVPAAPSAPKPDNRSWYQRQNKVVRAVVATTCVTAMGVFLYRKFCNKSS